jgi:hypothetical protein
LLLGDLEDVEVGKGFFAGIDAAVNDDQLGAKVLGKGGGGDGS